MGTYDIKHELSRLFDNNTFNTEKKKWIFHYQQELLRHRNQLSFIFSKSLRAFGKKLPKDISSEIWWYIIYRILWENASAAILLSEIRHCFSKNIRELTIKKFLTKISHFDWKIALKNKPWKEKVSLQYAIPSFFLTQLNKTLSQSEITEICQSIKDQSNSGIFAVYIPRNTFLDRKSITQKFLERCDQLEITPIAHPYVPFTFILNNSVKLKLSSDTLAHKNLIYLQELPSILTIYAASQANKSVSNILDMCCAPGIKTRLISSFLDNPKRIIAQDIHTERIRTAQNMIKNHEIHFLQSDSISASNNSSFIPEMIFLDAPCTGSGTFHTTPEIKWRQSSNFLRWHVHLQEKLIENAINLLKPKGILVYSTCSLYPEEGEMQFQKYGESLTPLSLPSWFPSSFQQCTVDPKLEIAMSRFLPQRDHTIGYFIGIFQKQ